MQKPKKWYDIYPYGTKEGDEEAAFFKSIARTKYDWRSTGAIVKESGLSRERVEEIIDKYSSQIKPPLVYAHPSNDDHWGYWERDKVKELLQTDDRDITKKDKDNRVDKHLKNSANDVTIISVP